MAVGVQVVEPGDDIQARGGVCGRREQLIGVRNTQQRVAACMQEEERPGSPASRPRGPLGVGPDDSLERRVPLTAGLGRVQGHRVAKHANAYQWVQDNDAQVLAQVTARTLLPAHHSTAALDTHLGTGRDYLDSRSFVLRNQRRTTAMLGLVRLHLNGTDITARYATALRAWLEAHHGTPGAQRTGYDAGTSRQLPAAARQVASLRR